MNRRSLAGGRLSFSEIVYGTWRTLADHPSAEEINRRLNLCADLGMTTIDTAEIYGHYAVEEALGRALKLSPGLRGRLQIVTKAGIYIPGPFAPDRRVAYYDASGAQLVASLEKSLRLLGTDRVELLLVHRPDWLSAAADTADGLNRLVRDGKIAAAGVSNYSAAQFDLLSACVDQPLATNQIEFHLLRVDPIGDGTLAQCEKLGVPPMAWSPLAGGRLVDPANEAARRVAAVVKEMAPRYGGATVEQLAYAWILAHPSRPLPIVGSNRPDRIRSAAAAAAIQLAREDWYALWQAAQGRPIP